MQFLLVLFPFLFTRSNSLLCNQCGGERYSGGLRLLRGMCCKASVIECASGLICLRAMVVSPRKSFILSGCHVPEDGLIGCDFHNLPHNATIHRCVCLDQACQSYFPTGNCSSSTSSSSSGLPADKNFRPNPHQRKSHALVSTTTTTTTQPRITTSTALLIASSPDLVRKEFNYAEHRERIIYKNSQGLWQFSISLSSTLVAINALICSLH